MTPAAVHAHVPRRVSRALLALSVAGLTGVVLSVWLGFEEPNSILLSVSAAMVLACPIAVLVHLACTRTIAHERKRVWWKALASAQVWSAFVEYLSSPDLAASADKLANEAEARGR